MFKLNPFIKISFNPDLHCDLPLEGHKFSLPSTLYITLFSQLKGEMEERMICDRILEVIKVDKEEADNIFHDLLANRILVPTSFTYDEMPSIKHWIRRGWMEALFLHLRSRNLEFDDTSNDREISIPNELDKLLKVEGAPEIWKHYDSKVKIKLGVLEHPSEMSLEMVLLKRRSNKPWRSESMKFEELSSVLLNANIESRRIRQELEERIESEPELLLNSSFTALETYCIIFSVDGIKPGLYHYDIKHHEISLLKEGLFRDDVVKSCIGQSRPREASCVFFISAIWERFMFRYRHERAYRTLLTNVSEFAQKYILLGTSLGLSTFLTPAFNDQYIEEFTGLDAYEEGILYAVALG